MAKRIAAAGALFLLVIALAGVFGAVLHRARINNPAYRGWANCKPGSWVRWERIDEGRITEGKETLISVCGSEATCVDETGTERKVPARVPPEMLPARIREREEEIEIAGRRIRCRRQEWELGRGFAYAVWWSEDIPGGFTKSEVTGPHGVSPRKTVIAWERK